MACYAVSYLSHWRLKWAAAAACLFALWLHAPLEAQETVAASAPAQNNPANQAQPKQAQPKFGPPYKTIPVNKTLSEDRRAEQQVRLRINAILRGSEPLSNNQNLFNGFYQQFVFAKMTQTDPESLRTLAEQRQRFFKENIWRASTPQVHDQLVDLTHDTMSKIVRDNYHPAVRFNAMIIIGQLNQEEVSGFGSDRVPAKPYLPALSTMLNELQKPNQLDAVKIAALVGILRHAELDATLAKIGQGRINRDGVRTLIDSMLQIVQSEPPPRRSPEGHQWMQRRAIDVLGYLGMMAPAANVAQSIDQVLAQDDAPIDLRCTAAQAAGRIKYNPDNNFNASGAAATLAELAADACKLEIDWWTEEEEREKIRELEKKFQQGGYGGYEGGGYEEGGYEQGYEGYEEGGYEGYEGFEGYEGMFGSAARAEAKAEEAVEEDFRITRTKRRLKYHAWCVKQGLVGPKIAFIPRPRQEPPQENGGMLARAATPEQKAEIEKVSEIVKGIMGTLDTVTDREELLKELRVAYQKLTAIANQQRPQPASSETDSSEGESPPGVTEGETPAVLDEERPPE